MHLSISIALLAVLGPFTLANPIDHAVSLHSAATFEASEGGFDHSQGSEIAAGHEISGRVDDPISSLQGAQAELTSTIEVLKSSNADPQMQTALNILEQSTQRFTSQLVITSSLIDSVATLINSILFPTTIVRNSVSELLHVMDITVVDLQSVCQTRLWVTHQERPFGF